MSASDSLSRAFKRLSADEYAVVALCGTFTVGIVAPYDGLTLVNAVHTIAFLLAAVGIGGYTGALGGYEGVYRITAAGVLLLLGGVALGVATGRMAVFARVEPARTLFIQADALAHLVFIITGSGLMLSIGGLFMGLLETGKQAVRRRNGGPDPVSIAAQEGDD